MPTAAALVIGNEILSGKVSDANVLVLAQTLRKLGVLLQRVVMVMDDVDTIAKEVWALSTTHDHVFTSGGVGPTHDDLTVEGVAKAFGVGVESSEVMEQLLRAYYGERLQEGHLLMARVPAGSRLVTSKEMPWPAVVKENVWVLPGVPPIFAAKMQSVVAELGAGRPFVSHAVYTNLDEGQLKERLDQVVAAFSDVDVGSYPKWGDSDHRTKLTFDGIDEPRVLAARDAFAASLGAADVLSMD